jgi:hypothetical protein
VFYIDTKSLHYIVEASGYDPKVLEDIDKIKGILINVARADKMGRVSQNGVLKTTINSI